MSTTWIEHNGKKVLYINFLDCNSEKDVLDTLNKAAELYIESPKKVLGLFDVNNTTISKAVMETTKQLGKTVFCKKREKSAIIGIIGIKKILLESYNRICDNALKPFDTKEQALDYLTDNNVK